MCGFIAILGPACDNTQIQARVNDSLASLAHRGPDGTGLLHQPSVILGHQRLSIIDLSDNGAQPMTDPVSGTAVVFNGEIYNYVELRKELIGRGWSFVTSSDTEVLLKAYMEWGDACIARLNGMFAFAIYDPRRQKVLFARDRFGVKPLYFCAGEGFFAAASEPKALLCLGLASSLPNDTAISHFLSAGSYATGADTFYQDIRRVEAAHYVLVNPHSLERTSGRYWDYPHSTPQRPSDSIAMAEEFGTLLTDAIRIRLRSDVPVGISLSGGLDSTSILAGATALGGRPPVCFTSTYDVPGVDELKWATLASERSGADLVQAPTSSSDWWETLQTCIHYLDGPVTQPAVVPMWQLMRHVRNSGIKVLLEGQGADELLGGYEQYTAAGIISDLSNPSRWPRALNSVPNGVRLFGLKTLLYSMLKMRAPSTVQAFRRVSGQTELMLPGKNRTTRDDDLRLFDYGSDHREGADWRLWLDHSKLQLPRLLHYGDAISMAHGVETRMPFMDYRLVEFAFSLPIEARLQTSRSKWMIREYLLRHGQREIALRSDKRGYPTPYAAWICELGKGDLETRFPRDSHVFQYVDRDRFFAKLRRHSPSKQALTNMLFRIVTMHLWLSGSQGRRLSRL